jgi:hypothetical protein
MGAALCFRIKELLLYYSSLCTGRGATASSPTFISIQHQKELFFSKFTEKSLARTLLRE